ncbi:hypothetical protein Q2446_27870, partial [Escherichia coli]|nr:hypothetical protein [Escherichia coli]
STPCIGCHTCEAACSETHRQHGLQSMPRPRVMLNEKEPAPQLCHHCEDAPCAVVCPVNDITRVDGAVQLPYLIHIIRCRGVVEGGTRW